MVRTGVAEHPSDWPFSGYNEIREPRRKRKLIAYDQLRATHRSWMDEVLKDGNSVREVHLEREYRCLAR